MSKSKVRIKKILSFALSMVIAFASQSVTNIALAAEVNVGTGRSESLTGISILASPSKTLYTQGTETLDVSGGKILLTYSDASTEEIDMTADMISGFDNTVLGRQTLTVTYEGLTAYFDVEITAKTVIAIVVSQAPYKLVYKENEEALDVTGGKIKVYYSNDTSETVDITTDMVSGFDNTVVGSRQLTVSYGGKTASFEVEIAEKLPDAIQITVLPAKLEYIEAYGSLDVTGGKIKLIYNDGYPSKTIDMKTEMITGFDITSIGKQTLTVSYAGRSATFEVEVSAKSLSSISMSSSPEKVKYLINADKLDVAGGKVRLSYNNGTREEIDLTADMVSGFDNTKEGRVSLSVTYGGCETHFFVSICAENTAEFVGGIGTEEYPYLIVTKENLNNVRRYPTEHFKMIDDIVFTAADFAEGGDFYNNGAGWQQIGNSASDPFTGVFDGNNHTIAGLMMNVTSFIGQKVHIGLFGNIKGGVVKNLGMVDGKITVDVTKIPEYLYIGGIAGSVEAGGKIDNCYNTGAVTATVTAAEATDKPEFVYIGGIIGYINSATVSNCCNTGVINVITNFASRVYTGGIVGAVQYGIVSNCHSSEKVVTTIAGEFWSFVGGIAGHIAENSTVSHCFNIGEITVITEDSVYTGGIAGDVEIDSTVSGCFNIGEITVTTEFSVEAGGIAGYINDASVNSSYNLGAITAVSERSTNAGGIAGFVEKSTTIKDCYNTGSIDAAGGFVIKIGGIIGIGYSSTVNNCYNTGNMEVSVKKDWVHAGGIIGRLYDSILSNCYNSGAVAVMTGDIINIGGITGSAEAGGAVNNCYNTGAITAMNHEEANIGGIAGSVGDSGTVVCCYNIGVTTIESSDRRPYIGSIVGLGPSATMSNCYYLKQLSPGIGAGIDSAIPCTMEELMRQETFSGFDFEKIWTMEGTSEYLYPELRNLPQQAEKQLSAVKLTAYPTKLKYLPDKALLEVTGGIISLYYNDGTIDEIDLRSDMISDYDETKAGSQVLTVTYNGLTDSFVSVVEKAEIPVTGVAIDENMIVAIHETKTPEYTVSPDFATNPKVVFTVEEGKENIAVIHPLTGAVTGVGIGSVEITITTMDGNFSAACTVTVICPGHRGDEGRTQDCRHQATCVICHQPYGDFGAHKYTQFGMDEICHWYCCEGCGQVKEPKVAHSGGVATETKKAVCEICGHEYGELKPNTKELELIEGEATLVLDDNYLYGVKDEQAATEILTKFKSSENVVILKADGTALSTDEYVGTGCKVCLMDENTVLDEVLVILRGDTNGDGKISTADYMRIRSLFRGTIQMGEAERRAADTDGENGINTADYMQIRNHFAGKFNLFSDL